MSDANQPEVLSGQRQPELPGAARRSGRNRSGMVQASEQVINVALKSKDQPMAELSDAELVARVQRGSKADFQILVERYQQRAFSVAWQILKRHEDAQDVVQESFVKAFLSIDSFQGSSSFFTWLYRIVVNMAIDFRRKAGRRERETVSLDVETRDGLEQQVDAGVVNQPENPLESALRGEQARQINQVLGEISDEHRAVIILREVEGLRYEQIAETLGISKGTVMSRLFYARKKLQQLLKQAWRAPEGPGSDDLNVNKGKVLPSK